MVLRKRTLAWIAALLSALLVGAVAFVNSGIYNVAADEPHWSVTSRMLESLRRKSVERRARDIQPPKLDDAQLISKGAGQYAEMCVICHVAPGVTGSATRQGLYPEPPELHRSKRDARADFWVIKHGLKMTGMPAWGATHDDETIWSLVAFLQRLPSLTPDEYRRIVKAAPRDKEMEMPAMTGHSDMSGAAGHGDTQQRQ